MVDFFIHRPVFATVCALFIILAGAVCIPSLPVAMYPALTPPQVAVQCVYVGADAQTVEKAVTIPLEEAINGVPGMRYINSSSTNSGVSQIVITFNTGYDLDIAAVDVQNRVASVQGRLPGEVVSTGITILKVNENFVFAVGFFSRDSRYSNEFISNYLDIYVKDALKRVPGVGDAMIFGERKYAMRIWLDPVRLAARGLTANDVVSALQEQNVEVPAGQLGQPPSDANQAYQIPVRVVGRLTSSDEFDNLIVKNSPSGGLVLLKDVGHAEVGAEDYSSTLKYSGHEAMGIGVELLPNANSIDVDHKAMAVLEQLKKNFPPGLEYAVAFDDTTAVEQSIHEVLVTLGEAIAIVIAVIFLFLLDWRATIIPAVTIPVSLIGTFAFIKLFGFSINTLTLFGITLATGLVVDDAIVVIENVQRHIHMEHSDAREATSRAMGEVTSAVIATSLVLVAVFVPVSFFPGTIGILYRQFSLTIAFSISISAFNALTLSPALSALFLRGEEARTQQLDFLHIGFISRAFAAFIRGADAFVAWLARTYARVVHVALQLRYLLLLVFFAGLGATWWMYRTVPTGFIPQEDEGYFFVVVQAPPGSSLTYTTALADRGAAFIGHDPDVDGLFSVMGFSFGGAASNSGLMFVSTDTTDPGHKGRSTADVVQSVSQQLMGLMFMPNGGLVAAFEPPAVEGVGSYGGFSFMLQDQGGNSLSDLDRIAHKIVGASASHKDLTGLITTFSANDPQELVTIDREKAKAMGVSITQISTTLNVFMGSEYINDFDYNNRTYRVYVQADRPFRMNAGDLHSYYVRSDSGEMVPLDNLVSVTGSAGPPVITHYNLFRAVEIDGSPAPGYSSGQGIASMEKLARENMMHGMTYEWTGLTLDEIESTGKALLIFGLGILVVYLTLSAQYESFALPFIILLAVPMAVLGALGLVSLRGFANDVYCQIGLVMLIGLAAKNSILIVEFAEQLRRKGRSIGEAAIEAAELRLRPILMTSFAFILGVLPLVFASGAGAQGRRSVGTTIVGGMLLSTVLNLVFIPALYVILSGVLRRGDPAHAEA